MISLRPVRHYEYAFIYFTEKEYVSLKLYHETQLQSPFLYGYQT